MLSHDLQTQLTDLLNGRFSTAAADRQSHSADEGWFPAQSPAAVCYPENENEVIAIVELCGAANVPLVPFGVGSSIEGQIIPTADAVCVDMSRMNQIVAVHREDMDVVVQAGVRRQELNAALAEHNLFFSVDPGANATVGGMISTRASGTNTVRYGTMADNVMSLKVVLPNGRLITTARRARKSSAGYNLTQLFVGAEGTLGLITEATLRVRPIPQAISAAVVSFPTVAQAVSSVIRTIQHGVPLARIELLDEVSIDAVNRYSGFDYPLQPTLFLEFHGTQAGVAEQAMQVKEIVKPFGGGDFQWTTDAAERNRLWHARHNAYYAALALRPGGKAITTDVCVPISKLAECIAQTKADVAASPLTAPLLGHVGDGNFHLIILIDPDDKGELDEAKGLNGRLVQRALDMGGTCTGEHGVGLGKQAFLAQEMGDALDLMRLLKQSIDPANVMNPEKIFSLSQKHRCNAIL